MSTKGNQNSNVSATARITKTITKKQKTIIEINISPPALLL